MVNPNSIDDTLWNAVVSVAADDKELGRMLTLQLFGSPDFDSVAYAGLNGHLENTYGLDQEHIEETFYLCNQRILERKDGR